MKIIKYFIPLLLVFFLFITSLNAQIKQDDLLIAAKNYIKADKLFANNKINSKSNINPIFNNKTQTIAYVVELQPEGFIVFSSSKKLYPVAAYSDKGYFDYKPSEYNSLLALIQTDLGCQTETLNKTLTKEQQLIIEKNQKEWDKLINNKIKESKYDYEYGPNLPDIWGGVNCIDDNSNSVYVGNYYTPNHYSPGCVATSLSQILNLFEWPPVGEGEHTDYDNSGASQGSYYAGFGRMWYDWDNMLDEYYGKASTDTERRAMGRIAYHCGVAVDMEYESNGSTSNVNRSPAALDNYFRSSGHYELGSWVSFWPRLRSNIENGYAVQFAIRDVSSGAGHANVCDGWRQNIGDDKYYHMNNGWWGTCNAWYRLQVSFSDCGYDAIDAGVFDILPDPMFSDEIIRDATDSKTFTIKWNVSKNLNWEAFELQESNDNGTTWTTLSNTITDTFYTRTVPAEGVYKYQVRAKSSGFFYANSYSEILTVPVEKIVYLNFDGDDSYYVKDNPVNDLDISDNWTVETWVEVDSRTSGTYPVILDRKTVFSMYLIDDTDGGGDYAIRFVARDVNGNITASVKSDVNSDINFAEWVHVAVTRDGTTTKMFINGKKVDESTDTDFSLSATTNALNIGARYWTTYERYLDGRIDEIRISDVARYTTDFCPDRFNRFNKDANTRILMCLDAFVGTKVKDYAYNFIKRDWRASTNDPSWASATCPIIMQEPEDLSLCQGSASFSVTAVQAGSYQWFEDTGSGYVALTDGGVYSGTTTATLTISDITGMDGYKYRCVVGNNAGSIFAMHDCSREALLTVYPVCTTWNGSAWSNGEPDINMSALIAGDYTLPYDISAKELTILSPYNVIVPPNLTLTVQNYFENHGTVLLQSNTDNTPTGALTLYGIQNNYGTMTAQRYISVPYPGVWANWHLISFPFEENFKVSDVLTGTYYLYENVEPTYSWNKLTNTDYMYSGNGYLLQHTETGGFMLNTEGNFGNGTYSHTLTLTSGTNLGWFLMANPYPCPIDWNAASGWTKININSTVYTFDPENNGGADQYSTWDGTVGTYSGSRYINSFQGFFVQALTDGAVIVTDNNVRVKNSDVSGDFLKKSEIKDIVRIEAEDSQGKKDEIVVYFGDTDKKSIKVPALNPNSPSLYISEGNNKYVIKRIKETEKNLAVALKFDTELSGTFKFNIKEFNNINYHAFLKNLSNNELYEIRNGDSFSFNNSGNNEFELLFFNENSNIKTSQEIYKIYSLNNSIFISGIDNLNSEVFVYDLTGKELYRGLKSDNVMIVTDIKTGFYIVKIKNKNNKIIKKILVY